MNKTVSHPKAWSTLIAPVVEELRKEIQVIQSFNLKLVFNFDQQLFLLNTTDRTVSEHLRISMPDAGPIIEGIAIAGMKIYFDANDDFIDRCYGVLNDPNKTSQKVPKNPAPYHLKISHMGDIAVYMQQKPQIFGLLRDFIYI